MAAMATHDPVPVARDTLEGTPARVLTFLRAVGTSKSIRSLLVARGYTPTDHQEAWALLQAVSGSVDGHISEEPDLVVRDAINALDTWDEDGFRLIRAALTRRHPTQAAFVLNGLSAQQGAGAVLGVSRLLDRLDALERGPDRKATRKADHAALASLATRGIDDQERARLRGLVKAAQSASKVSPPDTTEADETAEKELAQLTALRSWFVEWSETARVAVKRRDYLIRLGLASRRVGKKDDGGGAVDEAEPA